MFGKPVSPPFSRIKPSSFENFQENIRTYGAMIRANEEHVERNQTGVVKKERATVLPKRVRHPRWTIASNYEKNTKNAIFQCDQSAIHTAHFSTNHI